MAETTNSTDSRIEGSPDDRRGLPVARSPEELRPHPSYTRHNLSVDASQLSAVTRLGDLAFREPLAITLDGIILDGLARWTVARLQHRPTIDCLEYQMSELEALQYLLQRHRRSKGMNDFTRICLALELETSLKAKSQARLQAGGHHKGSSILTEAERLDVRQEIARIAGVSVGNVSKVRQLILTAHPDIIRALNERELFIHRAWLWSKLPPDEQRERLRERQGRKGIRGIIRHLISRHQPKAPAPSLSVNELLDIISGIQSGKVGTVRVLPVKSAGNFVFVTEELLKSLAHQKELSLTCDTDTR